MKLFEKNLNLNYKIFLFKQFSFLLPLLLMVMTITFFYPNNSQIKVFSLLQKEKVILYQIMFAISEYVNLIFYIIYLAILVYALKYRKTKLKWIILYYIAVQIMITFLSVSMIKTAIGRPRPFTGENGYQSFSIDQNYHSFPSGHTTDITGATGLFAQYGKSFLSALLWGLLPATMGFSRIFLLEHYPSDVLGGAVMGSIATYLVILLANRKMARLNNKN